MIARPLGARAFCRSRFLLRRTFLPRGAFLCHRLRSLARAIGRTVPAPPLIPAVVSWRRSERADPEQVLGLALQPGIVTDRFRDGVTDVETHEVHDQRAPAAEPHFGAEGACRDIASLDDRQDDLIEGAQPVRSRALGGAQRVDFKLRYSIPICPQAEGEITSGEQQAGEGFELA